MKGRVAHGGPLTVLFTESSRNLGGQERRLIFEARSLIAAGHRVEIATPRDGALFGRAASSGIAAHDVPMRSSLHPPSLWALARIMARLRPDVLYSHSGKDSWLAGVIGLATGTPLVRSRELLMRVRSASAYRLPRRVLACSEAVKRQLVEAGVPAAKVFVQYPPVDIANFSSADAAALDAVRREIGLLGCFPVVLCAGEFRPEKRQEDLVRAMSLLLPEFPAALLLLAGKGRELEKVRSLAHETGVAGHVRFLGEREDIPVLLSAADLYAFPSALEPFGMGPVEAMAAGVPVVASRTGGLVEIVEDGVNGFLVPPRDPKAIASALAALARDPGLRGRFSSAGRERARIFDSRMAMERLVWHFRAVVAGV